MPIYRLSPSAQKDLEKIWRYTCQEWGIEQAHKYVDELAGTFQLLAGSPKICHERPEFHPPVRIHIHQHHLIVYLIESDGILIVRVLHENMDVDEQLKD